MRHNLPVPLTSLVGRARELERVGETLRRTRLVTVTGPGGVGKTRLALALADRELARRSDGVWLVDLAVGAEKPEVATEVARGLGLSSPRGRSATETVRRYLHGRELLLVLDNCEHVVDACAELTAVLLSSCPELRILATSRELLEVRGETVWRLEPLAPDDAHRLFLERARQRQPELVPSEMEDGTIDRLCARLDHLPLAIELAAARVGVMSPAEILSSLDAPGGELGGVKRPAPPHHRTVRDAVAWSYGLLDQTEQQAFRRLAVFIGGFDAKAARSVVPELTVELLARLVDKSLIAATESQRGRTRYRLLETVREYAEELLGLADEVGAARDDHLRHFAGLADASLEEWLHTGTQWFVNELDDDYENVRAALEWAQASDPCRGLLVLAGTRDLFYKFGQRDGFRLAQLLLESCPAHDRSRAMALIAAGELASAGGEPGAAQTLLAEARELSAKLEEPALEAWAEWFLGITNTTSGRSHEGRRHLDRSLALHRGAGNRIGEARALAGLGGSYLFGNEPVPAKELYEAALSILVAEQNPWGQGMCHTFLGMIAEAGNDSRRSTSHYRQAVDLLRPAQDATLLPLALAGQASVLVSRDPATALTVLAAAGGIRERAGGEFQPAFKARVDRTQAAAVAKLGADADRLWEQGRRLDVDDAVALAFGTRKPRAPAPGGLSARELEVAGLVAEGLANKTIAARLHLSVRTIEVHVRHILTKLGLDNRTQLATWARGRLG